MPRVRNQDFDLETKEGKRAYYEWTATKIIPLVGWPAWPPNKGELPPKSHWWEKKESVLPTRPHFPDSILVSFDGLPSSGKSLLREATQKMLLNSDRLSRLDAGVLVSGEQLQSAGDFYIDNYLASIMDEDDVPPTLIKSKWANQLLLQIHKEIYYQRLIWSLLEDYDHTKHKVIVIERGPTDALIWQYAIASHKGDRTVEIPDNFKWILHNISFNTVGLFGLSARVDAEILFGTDQFEAKKRRPTRIVQSPFYQDLSRWYGHWVRDVFPTMHNTYGTGLHIVNGTKPFEENIPQIVNYIENLAERLLPNPTQSFK